MADPISVKDPVSCLKNIIGYKKVLTDIIELIFITFQLLQSLLLFYTENCLQGSYQRTKIFFFESDMIALFSQQGNMLWIVHA